MTHELALLFVVAEPDPVTVMVVDVVLGALMVNLICEKMVFGSDAIKKNANTKTLFLCSIMVF